MELKPDFWRGRRVLVTGHTGFKGGWLSLWLQHLGAEVSGYALAPATTPSLFEAARVASGMRSQFGDIRDASAVRDAVVAARPQVLLHLAAQPLVPHSYAEPVETYATNVLGTVHVLEAARAAGVQAVVSITTDKCYENREWAWGYRETDRLGGHDPYSNSKACAELVTAAYRDSYFNAAGVGVATARAGNVIGGGDWSSDRLLPDMWRALEKKQTLTLRNPQAVRPWQHVLEPLLGYLLLAQGLSEEPQAYSEAWNFGPGDDDSCNVAGIIERYRAAGGGSLQWRQDAGTVPHETQLLRLDSSKARQRLGWRPRWNLDMALARIAEWNQALAQGRDMRATSLEQIEIYRHA